MSGPKRPDPRRRRALGDVRGDRPDVGDLPVSEDVRREIDAHLAMETEMLIAEGLSPSEAREEALRRFGDVGSVQREAERHTRALDRSVRRARRLEGLRQDLSYAARRLRRSPGFTFLSVATLALGIGANTAIFSLINGVLLAPLPYGEPEALVAVAEEHEGGRAGPVPWPNYVDLRDQTRSLESLAVYNTGSTSIVGADQPIRARVAFISEDFFTVFRVDPLRGRAQLPEEHQVGASPAAVVSLRFWATSLGSDPEVLGRTLTITGRTYEVVGVMPGDFDFPSDTDLWLPLGLTEPSQSRTAHNYSGVGRLASGFDAERADASLDALVARIGAGLTSEDFDAVGVVVTPLKESLAGSTRRPLGMLMGASLLVLLIACVNLGSTLLARGASRESELAVRSALGARRGRIVRQLVTESMVLASLGGVAALGVAILINRTTAAFAGSMIPRIDEVSLDPGVLVFTLGLTLLTGLLFGVMPATRLARTELAESMNAGARSGESRKSVMTWRLLIGAEVALALMLLIGSGLLIRSFGAIMAQDTGADPDNVVAVDVSLDRSRYSELNDIGAWYGQFLAEAEQTGAFEGVGIANTHPVSGGMGNGQIELDGDPSNTSYGWYVTASAGYFDALDIPLLRGRMFDSSDHAEAAHVVLVSESFAEQAWPGEDPIGRQVTGGGMDNYWDERPFATVIGVVGDVRYTSLGRAAEPTFYFHLPQRPFRAAFGGTIVAEAAGGNVANAITVIRETMRRLDPELPGRFRLLEDEIGDSVADRRFTMMVLGGFAAVALLMSLIGIYGVVSYRVARRTTEMGLRLALGARRGQVLGLVMRDALAMVVGGVIVGGVLAFVGSRLLRSLLFGVEAQDPLAFAIAVPLLLLGAVVAICIPAYRATRIDPKLAMMSE